MNNKSLFKQPGYRLIKDPHDVRLTNLVECKDIALAGVPWDWGITGRPGSRYAPSMIRKFLYGLTPFSPTTGEINCRPADAGDINVAPGDWNLTRNRVRRASRKLYGEYRHVIFLGGDHSVSEWLLEPLLEDKNVGLLLLDAHYDMREVSEGYTSGMWLGNLLTKYRKKLTVAIVGIADYANPPYLAMKADACGVKVVSAREVLEDISIVLEAVYWLSDQDLDTYYVSIDVDHIDQAFAPGVNSPSPVGLHPHHTVKIMEKALPLLSPKAVDFVEVVPMLDHNESTLRLTAFLVMHAINLLQRTFLLK